MRVIGGEFRSRRLKAVEGLATRPTPDRLRETLFDVLGPRAVGAVFVDAYAGTGAVGIEALSRGAARCVFIENGRRAVEAIRENLRALGIEGRASVMAGKAVSALARLEKADIVFLDPPYELEGEYRAAMAIANAGLLIAQHSVRFDPGDAHGGLRRVRVLRQADNALSFYERATGGAGNSSGAPSKTSCGAANLGRSRLLGGQPAESRLRAELPAPRLVFITFGGPQGHEDSLLRRVFDGVP